MAQVGPTGCGLELRVYLRACPELQSLVYSPVSSYKTELVVVVTDGS